MAYVSESVRVQAAIIAGKSPEMDAAASRVQAIAIGVAARHRLTGAYIQNFSIQKVPGERGTGQLVTDRLVVNDDDGAAAIEWGYIRRFEGSRRVQYVPGQRIMTQAVRKAGG